MEDVPAPGPDVLEVPLDDATRRVLEEAEDALKAVRQQLARRGVLRAGPGLANASLVVARPAVRATLEGLDPATFPVASPPGPPGAWVESVARPLIAVLRAKVEEEAEVRGWI